MLLRAVLFDLGGVLLRTEFEAPRQYLAERLGLEYDDLIHQVFESPSARRASLGEITVEQHWAELTRRWHRPPEEAAFLSQQFFAGDVLDRNLLDFIRSLRPQFKTGLISNAWSDLRAFLQRMGIEDAFDTIIISAEVGLLKPDPRIYQLALERLQIAPYEALFVDDFPQNITAAKDLGMWALQFTDPEQTLQNIRRILDGMKPAE
ncbi:MAG: HAD family hydrolase [Anaerolineales bacterium]